MLRTTSLWLSTSSRQARLGTGAGDAGARSAAPPAANANGWLRIGGWSARVISIVALAVLGAPAAAHARAADVTTVGLAAQNEPAVSVQVAHNQTGVGAVEAGLSVRVNRRPDGMVGIETTGAAADGTPQGWILSGDGISPGGGCRAAELGRVACDATKSLNLDLGPGASVAVRTPVEVAVRRASIESDRGASDVTLSGPFRFEFLGIKLLAGDNRLTVDGLAETPDSWVLMGNGGDTVNASSLDTVTLAGGRDTCTCSSINKLSLGPGNDKLIGAGFGLVTLASGNDRALVTASSPRPGRERGSRARSRLGAANTITGGRGNDVIRVDPQADASGYRLVGMRGDDRFYTVGGGPQRVEGGSGRDFARIDRRDTVNGVDRVRRR